MKSKILLLGAVAAAFAISSFAAEPLLSPRAAGNQIKVVKSSSEAPAITVAYVAPGTALLSPRAQGNQVKVVQGVSKDSNPALACARMMSGSPKAITECASQTTMPGCASVASMK